MSSRTKSKRAPSVDQEELEIKIAKEIKKRNKSRHFVTSLRPRRKSFSPHRKMKMTRSKKYKSADDIQNMVADDMTRALRAESRLRTAKRKGQKTNIFDLLQKMPRDMQNEIYSMERDHGTQHLINPMSRSEVKRSADRIHSVALIDAMRKNKLNNTIYSAAYSVFHYSDVYHTFMFDTYDDLDESPIYHNNEIFATNFQEFLNKTRIEFDVTEDFIRYRVVPKYMKKLGSELSLYFDGFIVINRGNVVTLVNEDDWITSGNFELEPPDTNPVFTERTRDIMRTYFHNIENRRCSASRLTNRITGLELIHIRLDTLFDEDFSHLYPIQTPPIPAPALHVPANEVDHGNCCLVSGGCL